jgi:fluoroquinolone transport system permease protein
MHTWTAVRSLALVDGKSIRRDPMLWWLLVLTVALAAAFRWGIPLLTEELRQRFDFDLRPYWPLLLSFFAMTLPAIVGAVIGFLLLDQRDDGTLMALQVTPLTLRGFLIYRLAVPVAVSLLFTALTLPLLGVAQSGPGMLTLAATIAAPLAPIYALFMAAFAANKVQGFALMKAAGVVTWPAICAWFLPMPWQVCMGFVPHYWIAKFVWVAEEGGSGLWVYGVVAVLVQGALLWPLLRRFETVLHR